ncbi:hypothetical protein QVD17_04760 [Tagetes erecta]|uniref:Myb-like domain-containing protein n=1 Tax=Tagetes erecta TaxID=13708 RepID=A0AAD8PAZ9_TARER|nr:hypothetical protein QVD17_04760 [Tagetes erecta]
MVGPREVNMGKRVMDRVMGHSDKKKRNIFSLLHHLLPPSHRSTASSSSSTISIFHHPHRSTASSSSSTKNIFSLLHHHLHLHQPLSASRILFRLCCLRRLFSLFPERKNDESKQVQRSKVLAFAARYALFCNIIKMLFGADDAEYDKIVLDSVPSGCSGVLVSASVDSWDLGRPAEARFELLNQVLAPSAGEEFLIDGPIFVKVKHANEFPGRLRSSARSVIDVWIDEEVDRFYKANRKYGKDWKKVAAMVRTRHPEMVEALYTMNRAYLSLPEGTTSVVGFIAMVSDHYKQCFHKGLDVWSVGNRSSARPDWQGRGNLDYILASEAATKLQHQKQQHALAATKKQVIL